MTIFKGIGDDIVDIVFLVGKEFIPEKKSHYPEYRLMHHRLGKTRL